VIPKPLATVIIVLVTVVWAVNFAAQFIVAEYKPDVAINGIFMAVVGGALALSRGSKKSEVKDEEDPEPGRLESGAK
jgi:UDP-N-acetylglucosamine:LPS N-acetylglucosamine transferase